MDEVLQAMREWEKRNGESCTDIRIYSGGDGAFFDGDDLWVFDFDTLEEAIKKLKES